MLLSELPTPDSELKQEVKMDWGMKNRLSRIFQPESGRTVMLACDHGYFLGPVSRLEKLGDTIKPLIPYADALMITRGAIRNEIDPVGAKPVVLRVSGGTSIVGGTLSNEAITTSIKDAIKINASAITNSVFIGTEHEKQTLLSLSELVNQGEEYGIPVLAVTAVGKELEKRDARYLSLCCRICAELGAHFVKTYYCEDFEKVTGSCPVPIVIAGGPKLKTDTDALRLASEAIQRGASGVDMGRNIWQSKFPIPMIKAIRSIVHDNMPLKEAEDMFTEEKARITEGCKVNG
ncbi:3-hydroxy-5-phosphonooxypentane-2,4-dione thiolase [Candidatus Auribacterota bacterium]